LKRNLSRFIFVLVLLVLAIWGWRLLFPSPEQAIRKQLVKLARTASFTSGEAPMARLWNAQAIGNLFTADVEASFDVPGGGPSVLIGRDNLVERVLAARSALYSLKVEFPDISVTIGPDNQSAVAYVTARGKASGEREPFLQELEFTFQKVGRDWLIRKVETAKTLSFLRGR